MGLWLVPGEVSVNALRVSTTVRVPPGPPPRRGLVSSVRYFWAFFSQPIEFVRNRFEQYGDIYYAPSDGVGLYVIKHPEHIKDVLITRAADYDKNHAALRRVASVLGKGLLTSDGNVWRRHRRMIQPAFRKEALTRYAEVMAEEVRLLTETWRPAQTVELSDAMMALTLRVVSRTLFGHRAQDDTEDVRTAMKVFHDLVGRPDVLPAWIPTPGRQRGQRALAAMDRIVYDIIATRRKESSSEKSDLLQTLLELKDDEGGEGLTDEEIRDELLTLYIAGHETTSHALTWTLYLLSQYPEVDRALKTELDDVVGHRPVEVNDLPKLERLSRVVKESLRMYPPAYATGRRAIRDTKIGEYAVPAGAEIIVWMYMTHHDARWFPEPDVFRPERFSPEAEAERPHTAYLPFGAGPRTCIGKHFATLEAQLMLAILLSRFRFELAPGHRVEPQLRITMYPKHGMRMILRSRED